MAKTPSNARELLQVLAEKVWPKESHAWLYEVANGTGSRARRWADAVVCSCWPSRGLFLLGIEVKVSRTDWIKEFKTPEKSEPVQRFCDYWWLATTPGICKPEELPERWGLIEVGEKHTIVKSAPKLTPAPLDIAFIASLLRKEASGRDWEFQRHVNDLVEQRCQRKQEELDEHTREIEAKIRTFKDATGIDLTRWGGEPLVEAAALHLARRLMGYDGAARLVGNLEGLIADIKALEVPNEQHSSIGRIATRQKSRSKT